LANPLTDALTNYLLSMCPLTLFLLIYDTFFSSSKLQGLLVGYFKADRKPKSVFGSIDLCRVVIPISQS